MALVESAEAGAAAAARGATLVRLRAPLLTTREQERELEKLAAALDVPVIATSRADLAAACGAQGVHLVEDDLETGEVRRRFPALLIGRSVHSAESAAASARDGADYLLFGPVWATPTHPEARGTGLEALRAACQAAGSVPVLAVGGIDEARTERVMRAGAAGWAAIRMYA